MTRQLVTFATTALLLAPLVARAQEPAPAGPPLTIEAAVQAALARNASLRAARAGADAAGEAAQAAHATAFPRISAVESWQRGDQPVFVFSSLLASRQFAASNFAIDALNHPDPVGYFHTTTAIDQVIYDGGARSAATDSARAQQQLANLYTREAALGIATSVTELYGRLLAQEAARKATAAALDAGREDLARATNRRDTGVGTEADLLSLTVHVADLEQRLLQASGESATTRAQLNRLMGAPVGSAFEPVEPSLDDTPLPSLPQLLSEAAAQRPEIQRAAVSEQIADTARRSAKSAYLPKVAAQAALDISGTQFADRASSWLVGGEFRWSLGVGGAERAQMKAAGASLAKARAEAEDARAQVEVDVVSALQQVQSARARQAVGRAAVAQARESQRIIRDRYQAGLAPVNDVLRAASALLDADTQRVSALVDAIVGQARLARAVGRLPQ